MSMYLTVESNLIWVIVFIPLSLHSWYILTSTQTGNNHNTNGGQLCHPTSSLPCLYEARTMLGSSTSSTVSMSSFPVCRICRTSWVSLARRASKNFCFSCLTASCLGLNSSMNSLKEGSRTAKPAGSDTNVLHTAWRRLEMKTQMVIMKE